MRLVRKRKPRGKIEWHGAPDITDSIAYIVDKGGIDWVNTKRIYCMRSKNANTRAYARIWGLNRVWQMALQEGPAYVLEVISEKFDRLPKREKDRILIHELAHIPKNFSGSLMSHTRHGKGSFRDKLRQMIAAYER
jgi:predicted metallopeptidase